MTAFTQQEQQQFNVAAQNRNLGRGGKTKMIVPLSKDFSPGDKDVICAKGKEATEHPGNKRFRAMVNMLANEYGNAKSRYEKTTLVNQIMDHVHIVGGTFVRYESISSEWFEVSESMAREKVGQRLREKNHALYKSSTKSKRKLRKDLNQRAIDQISTVVQTNPSVAASLQNLSTFLANYNNNQEQPQLTQPPKRQQLDSTSFSETFESSSREESLRSESSADYYSLSDIELELAMTKANCQILTSLKTDESIQDMLKED